MQPYKDQRRDDRVRYDFPVYFFFPQGKRRPREVHYLKGFTQDVSTTGMRLFVEEPSPETMEKLNEDNAQIEVEIYLPEMFRSKPLTCRGEVRWREQVSNTANMMVGVDLIDLDAKHRDVLKRVAGTLREVTDEILGDGT